MPTSLFSVNPTSYNSNQNNNKHPHPLIYIMNQSNESNETTKCRYFNQGYCKKKNNCQYLHPIKDCEEDCSSSKCPHRHWIQCTNGDMCYYNSINSCEFKHDNMIKIIKGKFKEENINLKARID